MALAGLWTFIIVTTEPSMFAAQFHNRMPLVLEPDTWNLSMKGEPAAAAALMKPANEDVLVSRTAVEGCGKCEEQCAGVTGVSAGGAEDASAVEQVDAALESEFKAHAAPVAIGEQWMLPQESGCELTEEESALHAHLVRQWRYASKVLAELLERPLRQHS